MFLEDLTMYKSGYIENRVAKIAGFSTTDGQAFLRFFNLKTMVKCPYAKTAVITEHLHWNESLPFNSNLELLFDKLESFVSRCDEYRLDGFLVTAPSRFGRTPSMLGEFLRRILFYLSEHDPSGTSCLNEDLNDPKWRYRFSIMHFFVSSFSSCYSVSSSRSTNGIDQTIIIFQPKTSFSHAMSSDRTVKFSQREYIRDKFCRAGAPYSLRELECQKFVFPYEYADKAIEWWTPNDNFVFEKEPNISVMEKSRSCVLM